MVDTCELTNTVRYSDYEKIQNDDDWRQLVSSHDITDVDFFRYFQDRIAVSIITSRPDLTDNIIDIFKDKFALSDWSSILSNITIHNMWLSMEKMLKYWKYFNTDCWLRISQHCVMSEELIEKFQNKVFWPYISQYQKLSKNFVLMFQDKVNWFYIFAYQDFVTYNFVKQYKDKVDWTTYSKDRRLNKTIIRRLCDFVDWNAIFYFNNDAKYLAKEFPDKLKEVKRINPNIEVGGFKKHEIEWY